jgi:hypothetical protein
MRLVLLAVLALAWGGCQTAQAARAQHSSREKGRLQKRLFCHKNDYRDAEAIGHRT